MGFNVLSMGAGVQTTAILIKNYTAYDYVIFADTGDEKKETYYYIEHFLKPFCKEKGVEWVTVKSAKASSIMEWCMKRKILPIMARRWCTKDFKIVPINKFIREHGATAKDPANVHVGISLDEVHRANFSKYNPKYVNMCYPLLDMKMTRTDCENVIKEHGWPLPVKSGCDFCPFQKRSEIRALALKDPERFAKIVEMEKNDRAYPKRPLLRGGLTLEAIRGCGNITDYIPDYVDKEPERSCDSGHCFY